MYHLVKRMERCFTDRHDFFDESELFLDQQRGAVVAAEAFGLTGGEERSVSGTALKVTALKVTAPKVTAPKVTALNSQPQRPALLNVHS